MAVFPSWHAYSKIGSSVTFKGIMAVQALAHVVGSSTSGKVLFGVPPGD